MQMDMDIVLYLMLRYTIKYLICLSYVDLYKNMAIKILTKSDKKYIHKPIIDI